MLKIDRLSEDQRFKENSDLYKANLEKDRKRKSLELANAKAKMSNAERNFS